MSKVSHPRRGSMQYWPRVRSKHRLARIRSWASEGKARLLGFIGFKVGMTHVMAVDSRLKSMTKGEKIQVPVTMIECPPMVVLGAVFYKETMDGLKKAGCVMAGNLPKNVSRLVQVPKVQGKSLESVKDFDDVRVLVGAQCEKVKALGTKKPKIIEIVLGGSKDDKVAYIKDRLGKEISVSEVFEKGAVVDVHGVGKGKGFQGTVKRFGVPIRQHKAEKTKRGIATLGSWTPKRVEFTVPQSGKMGYHLRTEYNKQVLKVVSGEEVTSSGGIIRYGRVTNPCLLVAGSVVGPQKRAVLLNCAIRTNKPVIKDAFDVVYISR